MTDQSINDMLLAIPAEVVQVYFPHNTEEEYQKAAKHLERKLKQFRKNFKSRKYPISGEYVLDHFENLCSTLPELMCSIVFIGRHDDAYVFPVVEPNPRESLPQWDSLTFETIIQAEQLIQACVIALQQTILDDQARQAVYGDLKRQINILAGAVKFSDLRGVYGMM